MFYLKNSLMISPLLLVFMFSECGFDGRFHVGGCDGVENPYVKKCTLKWSSPKSSGLDVQTSIVIRY
jgi:hypothetical protein